MINCALLDRAMHYRYKCARFALAHSRSCPVHPFAFSTIGDLIDIFVRHNAESGMIALVEALLCCVVCCVLGSAPALGLSPTGLLYWGQQQLAHDVTSVALRGGGPGGPALVYTTRNNLMYTVLLRELRRYLHQTVSNGWSG